MGMNTKNIIEKIKAKITITITDEKLLFILNFFSKKDLIGVKIKAITKEIIIKLIMEFINLIFILRKMLTKAMKNMPIQIKAD